MRVALQLFTHSTVEAPDHGLPAKLQAGAAEDRSGGKGRPKAQEVRTGQQAEGDCATRAATKVSGTITFSVTHCCLAEVFLAIVVVF